MGFEDYIILEAYDRFGGRLKSIDNFHDEVPLDVGAEWIHASNEQMVKDKLLFQDQNEIDQGLAPSEFIKYQPEFVRKQVLFAGEHTSEQYFSLVPDTAMEGRRAAVEALLGQSKF